MRAAGPALAVLLLLPGCLGSQRPAGMQPLSGEGLEAALSGRTVVYRAADPERNVPPLHQTWNADGTLLVDRSPLARPDRVWQDRRFWWVEGARYCETADAAERGGPLPDGRCQRVALWPDGAGLSFETERRDLVADLMFPRIGWSGAYADPTADGRP